MLEKLKELSAKNKFWFYLLLPLVAIAFILKFLLDFNIIGAKKDLDKAEDKDKGLKNGQDAANKKANNLANEAKVHNAKAEMHEDNANKADAGVDWHEKR